MTATDEQILQLVELGLTNAQLAGALGITERTLTRWRVARPALSAAIIAERKRQNDAKPEPPHGTRTRYNKGCRCVECREAHSAAHYEWSLRAQRFATRYGRRSNWTPGARRAARQASTIRERIEQAIARGESTSRIITDLGVSYDQVQNVRDGMERDGMEVA